MMDETCSQKTNTINQRMSQRNIPSSHLQPYFSSHPVLTRYTVLPIVDARKSIHVPVIQQPTYSPQQTFNPGTAVAPWSGFAANVNVESDLRNQIFALQKNSQSVYVPSSKSDLYKVNWKKKRMHSKFSSLFLDYFKNRLFHQAIQI